MGKIFIAEDDPLMSRMYERAFKLNNYEIEQAFDGEEAIAKLETMNPKPILIILDVMMPKMTGFDVLKHIKTKPDLKSIPVIMLSNLAGQEDAEKALTMGAVLYLVKSQYEPKQIMEKIKEIITGYQRKNDIPTVKVQTKDIEDKSSK